MKSYNWGHEQNVITTYIHSLPEIGKVSWHRLVHHRTLAISDNLLILVCEPLSPVVYKSEQWTVFNWFFLFHKYLNINVVLDYSLAIGAIVL